MGSTLASAGACLDGLLFAAASAFMLSQSGEDDKDSDSDSDSDSGSDTGGGGLGAMIAGVGAYAAVQARSMAGVVEQARTPTQTRQRVLRRG